jgi:hypothetical protein
MSNKARLVPDWWSPKGFEMHLAYRDDQRIVIERTILVKNVRRSVARIEVERADGLGWIVVWRIDFPNGVEFSAGKRIMTDQDLAAAFGLDDYIAPNSEEMAGVWDLSAAKQGCFVRQEEFLNIPCRGTGDDGDPNISLEITTEIKKAISALLSSVPAKA